MRRSPVGISVVCGGEDVNNGLFEGLAGLMVLNHCRVLYADKSTRGVSVISSIFFTIWGCWNLYYYPTLKQPISFYGGLFVVAANAVYVGMMMFYRQNAKKCASASTLVSSQEAL